MKGIFFIVIACLLWALDTLIRYPLLFSGTNAEMIKLAMIAIYKKLAEESMNSKMVLQIHDELLFEAPKAEVDDLIGMVTEEMVKALPLDIPIVVDSGVGESWFEAH